eukprot:Skav233723  [mRNA]  locus=scaffold2120:417119:418144:+ [translate_table: standard]
MKAEVILTDAFISALAEAQGWSDEWMTVQEPKARGRGPKAVAADMQRAADQNHRIPDMMKAASQAVSAPGQPAVVPPAAVLNSGAVRPPPPRTSVPAFAATGSVAAPKAGPAMPVPKMAPRPRATSGGVDEAREPESVEPDAAVGENERAHMEPEVAAGETGAHDDSEDNPLCAICQEPLQQEGAEVQMLACGHVWHKSCLERSWAVSEDEREPGWCPYRCDVRAAAEAMDRNVESNANAQDEAQGPSAEPRTSMPTMVL